ncbi:MAG: hypothetical protein H6737_26235 [Alphaproteobacteria bacterium]|nr:hypothetical protein [Alphaproteobacteria bacterium]
MLALLAALTTASAQDTRVFASDQAATDWVLLTRATMRTRLPVVGPEGILEWKRYVDGSDVELVVVDPSVDPEEAAIAARSKLGSPCTLAFAALDEGQWAGWVSGHCGLLFLGAWRYQADGRVIDDRGRFIPVPQFAADAGDLDVMSTYKRLDRVRGRAIWNTILGTGLLYVGQVGLAAARNEGGEETGWWITTGVGGALTAAGVGQFIWVQADRRSHPRDLLAHYTEDEIKVRIEEHNSRLRLVSVGPGGIRGTF